MGMTNRHRQTSHGNIPKDIDPAAYLSVVALLAQAMQRFADKPAFRCLPSNFCRPGQLDRQPKARLSAMHG